MQGSTRARGAAVLVAIGGFFVLLGGLFQALLGVVVLALVGVAPHAVLLFGAFLGVALLVDSVLLWGVPRVRFAWGGVALALAVLSLPFASLGGFLVGFVLVLVGAAIAMFAEPRVRAEIVYA